MSFPRSHRLLTAQDYDTVFRGNKRVANQYWTVLGHRHQNPNPRLGMAIAKKRAKRAVTRNRIKRICRESFRLNADSLAGFDIVVMNRDAAAVASRAQLRSSLDELWRKLSQRPDTKA